MSCRAGLSAAGAIVKKKSGKHGPRTCCSTVKQHVFDRLCRNTKAWHRSAAKVTMSMVCALLHRTSFHQQISDKFLTVNVACGSPVAASASKFNMALHCLPTQTGLASRTKSVSSCLPKQFSIASAPVVRQHGHSSTPAAACAAVQPHRPSAASVSSEPAAADAPAVTIQSMASYEDPLVCVPEDFELAPGVLSSVDRTSPAAPEDAYRCIGCTRLECQVRLHMQRPPFPPCHARA
jgi:hypothetical protein